MAIKSADQISIVDVTDAYSVILTSEAYTFVGTYLGINSGVSCSTQAVAFCGATQCKNVTVDSSAIICPDGISATVSNNNSAAVTVTFETTKTVTDSCEATIPVSVEGITINKKFSFAVAKRGATGETGATGVGVKSTVITYQKSSSGTTIPTGTWSETIPSVSAGQYLWTRTVITYTDDTSSTSYSVGMMGATGAQGNKGDTGATGNGVKSTAITYQKGTSGTTAPTGTWSETIPAVGASEYLWTRTVITYTDNTTATSYSVGMMGATGAKGDKGDTGAAGADAITLSITSSNGTIFKNSAIATVLTAHVYKAGKELSASEISALGTIKWYKDGSTTAAGTGATLTIDAGDVTNKATYVAQLEG